jgi:hypothetical protein
MPLAELPLSELDPSYRRRQIRALPSNTFKGRSREKRCFRVRITKSAVLRNKPLDELLPRIKIAVGVFASTIIVEGLQFILDPPAYFRAESGLAAKAQKSPSKKQNARREFPPGVKVQPEKFFSWLRPGVKTEKAMCRCVFEGERCNRRLAP